MKALVTVAERPAGRIPTTSVTNELARAHNANAPVVEGGQVPQQTGNPVFDIWIVWDEGPNGETDPTNHTYWLRRAYLSNASGEATTTPAKLKEIPVPDGATTALPETWILATNLAERPPNTLDAEVDGPHGLFKGQTVGPVWQEEISAQPSAYRWVFSRTTNPVMVKITGFTSPSALGGGKYWCRVQRRTTSRFIANSTNLSMITFYTDISAVDAMFLNTVESGTADHNIGVSTYHLAREVDPTVAGVRVFEGLGLSFAC